MLLDIGVPLSNDSKYDWSYLKDKILEHSEVKDSMKDKNVQQLERFVQRTRMICQQLIQQDRKGISMYQNAPATLDDNADPPAVKRQKTGEEDKQEQLIPVKDKFKFEDDEESKNLNDNQISYFEDCLDFDPDNDGFGIDFKLASKLHKRLNMLYFIRKELLPGKAKLFISGLDQLKEEFARNDASHSLPENWDPAIHDKALIYAVSDNGFKYLTTIAQKIHNSMFKL
jgi:hypothetical protein